MVEHILHVKNGRFKFLSALTSFNFPPNVGIKSIDMFSFSKSVFKNNVISSNSTRKCYILTKTVFNIVIFINIDPYEEYGYGSFFHIFQP